jgi:intracellular sulfur oxidation DsrE/DsrF family protein
MYDYSTLASYADKLYEAFDKNKKNTTDTVTHMRYGPDISFELCDKDNKTVELGQLQLTLDGMDASGNLQCGFGVSVNDYDKGTSFGDIRRNIIYVDNSSTLFVKQINLGGKVLSTDKNGKLLMNNKIVQLFPVEDAVVFHLTSTDNYKRLFTNIDKYIELNPTVQIKVVLDSNGINLMTTNFVTDNTIETQIKSYLDKSVVFEVSENTMFNNNMTKDMFIEGSTFITFAIQRYVELCREGFIGIEQQ